MSLDVSFFGQIHFDFKWLPPKNIPQEHINSVIAVMKLFTFCCLVHRKGSLNQNEILGMKIFH